jgi:hypothetical protein
MASKRPLDDETCDSGDIQGGVRPGYVLTPADKGRVRLMEQALQFRSTALMANHNAAIFEEVIVNGSDELVMQCVGKLTEVELEIKREQN